MPLQKYKQKRKSDTPEPFVSGKPQKNKLSFVIHRHAASQLHFDLRLEHKGVLKSWPIPRGITRNTKEKHLAIQVEDHPFSYLDFEGEIPKGSYGAGMVEIWDSGHYYYPGLENESKKVNEKKIERGFKKGHIKFFLDGKRVKGEFSLIKLKKGKNTWLLIKDKDSFVDNPKIVKKIEKQKIKRAKGQKEILEKAIKKFKLTKEEAHQFKPMLARTVEKPFSDKDWIFEIKYDGFRAIAETGKRVRLYSRNQNNFKEKFSDIANELERFDFNVVLDGEIVAFDHEGKSSFSLLKAGKEKQFYAVFDILALEGYSLKNIPLIERKKILKRVLSKKMNHIFFTEHINRNGEQFFDSIKNEGLEGIIAKEKSSLYVEDRRSPSWVKIKTKKEVEAYIIGYTLEKNKKNTVGSFALATKNGKTFRYIGNVGTGISNKERLQLFQEMKRVTSKKSILSKTPKYKEKIYWVKPKIKAEISFSEYTADKRLRHPAIKRLVRKKGGEKEIVKMVEKTIEISHPQKVLFPKEKITKADLVRYYESISPVILSYLEDRPLALHRFPDGVDKKSFFQKDFSKETKKWLQFKKIYSKSQDRTVKYLVCNDLRTLLYIVNLGTLEIHPWSSRIQHINKPDFAVIDLDPVHVPFKKVIKVANEIHKIFSSLEIPHYPKTSGKKGIHIIIPLGAKYTYMQVLDFVKILALIIHSEMPKLTSLERIPAKRDKKIYIDIYQNRKGQTIVAPYSTRPTQTATVSTPLLWEEVNGRLNKDTFTIKTVPQRIEKMGDIFEGIFAKGIYIDSVLKKIDKKYINKTKK